MSNDFSDWVIMRKLFGEMEKRPKALRREFDRSKPNMMQRGLGHRDNDSPDFLDAILRDELDSQDKKQVLRSCPGLLFVSVQGELTYSRGLSVTNYSKYDRKYTEAEDVDHTKYPYNFGILYIDFELLTLLEKALLLLRPDGFYFSPAYHLYRDLYQIYKNIEDQSIVLKEIFPMQSIKAPQDSNHSKERKFSATTTTTSSPSPKRDCRFYFAMLLFDGLQRTRKTARACFSVDDMRLLANASSELRGEPKLSDEDLIWAVLYCPELSRWILKALKTAKKAEFFTARVTCKDGLFEVSAAIGSDMVGNEKATGQFKIPLVSDSEFTGEQLIGAVALVFITFYWIEKKWVADVAAHDNTIPQNVLMC